MLGRIMNALSFRLRWVSPCFSCAALFIFLCAGKSNAQPFSIQGTGVNPADFRVTAFATNVYFPLGMVQLSDSSLLVAISQGSSHWSGSVGKLLRITDTNQ